MTKHTHADLMLQYAQDATETDKPWERWEYRGENGYWRSLPDSPLWESICEYRRKPAKKEPVVRWQWVVLHKNGKHSETGNFYTEEEIEVWRENTICDYTIIKKLDYTRLECAE